MKTKILSGIKVSEAIKNEIKEEISKLEKIRKTILYCDKPDESNEAYMNQIVKVAGKLSFPVEIIQAKNIEDDLKKFNEDKDISGVMFMHPFKDLDENKGLNILNPKKDIEGRTEINFGKLFTGKQFFSPPTAEAVMEIIKYYQIEISGKRVVILGRSTTVGKPLALMLLKKGVDGTVTVCHSRTKNIDSVCREADILVSAIGQSLFVKREMVKDGAVVIDVGFNYFEGKYVGDTDYENILGKASSITPVPKGVGSVTTAILMRHIYQSNKTEV